MSCAVSNSVQAKLQTKKVRRNDQSTGGSGKVEGTYIVAMHRMVKIETKRERSTKLAAGRRIELN